MKAKLADFLKLATAFIEEMRAPIMDFEKRMGGAQGQQGDPETSLMVVVRPRPGLLQELENVLLVLKNLDVNVPEDEPAPGLRRIIVPGKEREN